MLENKDAPAEITIENAYEFRRQQVERYGSLRWALVKLNIPETTDQTAKRKIYDAPLVNRRLTEDYKPDEEEAYTHLRRIATTPLLQQMLKKENLFEELDESGKKWLLSPKEILPNAVYTLIGKDPAEIIWSYLAIYPYTTQSQREKVLYKNLLLLPLRDDNDLYKLSLSDLEKAYEAYDPDTEQGNQIADIVNSSGWLGIKTMIAAIKTKIKAENPPTEAAITRIIESLHLPDKLTKAHIYQEEDVLKLLVLVST